MHARCSALLYDIHGNLPALEAVLADARAAAAPTAGCSAATTRSFGGWPAETVDAPARARRRDLDPRQHRALAGRPERARTASPLRSGVQAAARRSAHAIVDELGALPESAALGDGDARCHASPVTDMASFLPEPGADERELLDGVADRAAGLRPHPPVLRPRRRPTAIELVNPGSVGMPLDGDHRAAYALMHDDGAIEHRRVDYDHAASAARVREVADGAPWGEVVAGRIERASMA